MNNIVVVLPTYNACNGIIETIKSIRRKVPDAIIFVIDDNSPDGTALLVKEKFKTDKKIVVKIRNKKGGRGSAILLGFKEALKNTNIKYFVEMDADMCHDPKYIPTMIKKTKSADMVIVSKYLPKSTLTGVTLYRIFLSKMMNFAARLLLQVPISDYSNGYRLYTRDVVEYITKLHYQSKGFVALSETVYRVYKKGYKIAEIPFDFIHYNSQNSNMNLTEMLEAIQTLLKLRYGKYKKE